jgi:hypothetical protein
MIGTITEPVNEIHLTLKKLMALKSEKDGVQFSIYQLAKQLDMPHSMLVKLMHQEPIKRVSNPRVETLAKIVAFFKAEGFDITIDDLLAGLSSREINVQDQQTTVLGTNKTIPLYSFDQTSTNNIGKIDVNIPTSSSDLIALLADEDIKPMFKNGSIFIIDTTMQPENDMLVAVKLPIYPKVKIMKYLINGSKKFIKSLNENDELIQLLPTMSFSLIGVVIQAQVKT